MKLFARFEEEIYIISFLLVILDFFPILNGGSGIDRKCFALRIYTENYTFCGQDNQNVHGLGKTPHKITVFFSSSEFSTHLSETNSLQMSAEPRGAPLGKSIQEQLRETKFAVHYI